MSKRTWSETFADDAGTWSYEVSAETLDGVEHIGITLRDSSAEISVDLDAFNASDLRDRLTEAIKHVGGG